MAVLVKLLNVKTAIEVGGQAKAFKRVTEVTQLIETVFLMPLCCKLMLVRFSLNCLSRHTGVNV